MSKLWLKQQPNTKSSNNKRNRLLSKQRMLRSSITRTNRHSMRSMWTRKKNIQQPILGMCWLRQKMESINMNAKDKFWMKLMKFGHCMGCHQMPERSFFIKGYQFPVCARCTGVIIGEILEIILLLMNVKINIFLAIGLLANMGIDWFIQHIKWIYSNNIRRLMTGICGGIGLTYLYYYLIIVIIQSC